MAKAACNLWNNMIHPGMKKYIDSEFYSLMSEANKEKMFKKLYQKMNESDKKY